MTTYLDSIADSIAAMWYEAKGRSCEDYMNKQATRERLSRVADRWDRWMIAECVRRKIETARTPHYLLAVLEKDYSFDWLATHPRHTEEFVCQIYSTQRK